VVKPVEVKPAPVVVMPVPVALPPAPVIVTDLAILQNMGFTDRKGNLHALTLAKGDIATAVQYLIDERVAFNFKWN